MQERNADGTRYVVGFFAEGLPGTSEIWRPTEDADERCDLNEASRRFASLQRSMLAGETVDGLRLASAYVRDADDGETILSRTADGSTTTENASDAFGMAGARFLLLAGLAAQNGLDLLAGAMREAAGTGNGTASA